MKHVLESTWIRNTGFIAALLLAAGAATTTYGQGEIASGTLSGSGSGPYLYNLTFSDSPYATSPIGSVWYAWVPGEFYLPGTPSSASAPTGWTATVFANSVQFVANSSAYDIQPGQSLSGFGYQASFSPAQLAAAANSGLAVAYSGGLFSDGGNTFTVATVTVPEPSTLALISAITMAFGGIGGRSRRAA